MARVLIAGCGDVGTALGLALSSAGHEVWALRRNTGVLPAPLRCVQADLCMPETLRAVPGDVEILVYTAAAGDASDRAYRRAYVEGPANIRAALLARGAPLRRVLFVSSTAVYAQSHGEWVDETSPTRPAQATGRRLLEGEALMLDGSVPGTAVRFGGIYGPGRTQLIDRVRAGATCIADPPQYTNRIHRDDCARVLQHLLTLDVPDAHYLAVDDEPAAQCEVMDWLAAALAVAPPVHHRRGAGSQRNGRASKRCSNSCLRQSGFEFRYPSYREGYAAILNLRALAGNISAI